MDGKIGNKERNVSEHVATMSCRTGREGVSRTSCHWMDLKSNMEIIQAEFQFPQKKNEVS